MIPLRITMTGWMRYRDETVADLSDGRLIAVCGENGAGKSSIFDAITFALYGQHRLGKQKAEQLVSEDRDRLSVEFEFEGADGGRYMVRRSRGKKAGERDQSLWLDDGSGGWAPVPGTEKEEALDRAIAHVVRLSHGAFTASFLLQQGEATQFIDSDPRDRFEILAGLIGLKEYERLERAAREAAKAEKTVLETLERQLNEIGDLDAEAIKRLRADAAAASARMQAADAALFAVQQLVSDATRFAKLGAEIADLDAAISASAELVAEKESIERDAQLFERLTTAIATVQRVKATLDDAARAASAAAATRRKAAAIDVDALAAASLNAASALESATRAARAADKTHEAAVKAEREAADFARAAYAFLDARDRVDATGMRLEAIGAAVRSLSAETAGLQQRAADTQRALDEAEAGREAARADAASATARAEHLTSELATRQAAAKEATCSRCGQPVDGAAAKRQVGELKAALGEAQAGAKAALTRDRAATSACTASKRARDAALTALHKLEKDAASVEAQRVEVRDAAERAASELAQRQAELGERAARAASAADDHARAKAGLTQTAEQRRLAQTALSAAQRTADDARAAAQDAKDGRAQQEGRARELAATERGHRDQAAAFASGLGELSKQALTDPVELLAVLRTNERELAAAPARKAALDKAEREHTAAAATRAAREEDLAAIPEAHRVAVDEAACAAREAQACEAAARAEHQALHHQLAGAEARIDQAARLRDDAARSKLRHKRLNVLTRLLGRNGLQGELIRSAVTDIKNHANAFLRRLTGGSLELTIEEVRGALELQAIDHTCMRTPRSAKALSGSQKFRSAVAIASGIGQYAGAGGMRSIVIDEGFASLDEGAQRVMVDELQNLATHMDKVIVVSHLQAFNDPACFPDRLIVETEGAASTIRRATA